MIFIQINIKLKDSFNYHLNKKIKMSKTCFNNIVPIEIERYILDIKTGIEQNERMMQLKSDIIFRGTCNYLFNLPSFEWFNYMTLDESIDYMNILTNCKCCLEHQKRRPTTKMYVEGLICNYSTKQFRNDKPCKCKCRHLARDLCREMNDIEEEW